MSKNEAKRVKRYSTEATSEGLDSTTSESGSFTATVKNVLQSGTEQVTVNSAYNITDNKTNFDQIVESTTSYDGINVSMYKSRKTGLKVLVANVQVPIVLFLLFERAEQRCMDTLP
jgi:hypothetical protein